MAPEDKSKQVQIEGLATLLVLNDEIRKLTSLREFGFYATNETHHLVPYHTAYLWQPKFITGIEIIAQSGIAEIDEHAPANQWLAQAITNILSQPKSNTVQQIHILNSHEVNDNNTLAVTLTAHEDFADYLLWCPFVNKSGEVIGGLILFRETKFDEDEIKMLRWLLSSYQYTLHTLQKQRKTAFIKKLKERPYLIAAYIAIAIILLFPTRLTVFGTGTVVPKNPTLINAPIQGVIDSFAVNPGERVEPGQLLLTLDKTDLEADVEVSKRNYLLTQAKLRSAVNEGFDNPEGRSDIPLLRAQLAIDQAHLNYTNSLLAKTNIKSPAKGIVIFDSKEDWIGQPIQTGERILIVANPSQVQLEVALPVTNYIELEVGNKGKFYLYGQLSPMPLKIRTLAYNAEILPNKLLGYQLIADFTDPDDKPQFGSQGNVEVYSTRVPFIYYILRRPIQAGRKLLGI